MARFNIDRIVDAVLADYDSDEDGQDPGLQSDYSLTSDSDSEEGVPVAATWSKVNENINIATRTRRQHQFQGRAQLNEMPVSPTPYGYFRLFFTPELVTHIVEQTNLYAEQVKATYVNRNKKRFGLASWKAVNDDELMCYFAVVILMGIVHKPDLKSYWSGDSLTATPFFQRIMSRDRFLSIRRVLHFNDNTNQNAAADKFFKLRPVLTILHSRFSKVYSPGDVLVIDEILELFKGRLSWIQYIPSKRERWGFKFFLICDSTTTYICNFQIYVGKETNLSVEDNALLPGLDLENFLQSTKVVLHLTQKYFYLGHTLVVDNWYSSPELMSVMNKLNINIYGTLRSNRKGLPVEFNSTKPKKGELVCWTQHPATAMTAFKWSDPVKKKDKIVSCLSSIHGNEMVDSGKKIRGTDTVVMKPAVIVDYIKNMGAVDNVSKLVYSYKSSRKGLKWFRKLFEILMDLATMNAYVLFKKHHQGPFNKHDEFLKELVNGIFEVHFHGSAVKHVTGRGDLLRLVDRHFPALIPPTANKTNPTRQCQVCSTVKKNGKKMRKESRYFCADCNVALCVVPCFRKFHTMKKYDYQSDDSDSSSVE